MIARIRESPPGGDGGPRVLDGYFAVAGRLRPRYVRTEIKKLIFFFYILFVIPGPRLRRTLAVRRFFCEKKKYVYKRRTCRFALPPGLAIDIVLSR